ncbi:PLAC8-domain-containing protein [Auricularia subglabra TFB-10046 SS5]|nr:PLAC8-domain-containing protein [Auricularia subglabra TFB-10046 SS5]
MAEKQYNQYNQQPQYGQQPMHAGGNVQMQPTIAMHPNGGNRNAKNLPLNSSGEREWSNGLCSCFGDCGTCCVAWCFPCIVYGQNKTRREHLEQQGFPHPTGGESCGSDCLLHGAITACFGFGWIFQIGERGATRRRYNIEGGGCGDCCSTFWCNPCALTQESREIQQEEESMIPKQ